MENQLILKRLKELQIEEQTIQSKLDCQHVFYDRNEWFPSSSMVKLMNDAMIVEGSHDDFCYISYLETNNSFDLPPQKSFFRNIGAYSKLNVRFSGEKSGNCKVQLCIVTYMQQSKSEIFAIELNSSRLIELNKASGIRLALRVQGNGRFKLHSIVLEPGREISISNVGNFYPTNIPKRLESTRKLKVAIIADEFTFESLKYDCELIYLSPKTWLETLSQNRPDIFFCESAWSGKDSVKREWKAKIYKSISFKHENRSELLNIIEYCKKNGILTVFWNKEDPSYYEDKMHNFVDTALKFDYIFTTAEECVERYKKEYKHPNVYSLMFAVQPKLFNPIETCERTDDFIFSGSYYRHLTKRSRDMERLFDLILEQFPDKLIIYNRHFYSNDANHIFPEKFKPYIRPALTYTQLDKGYKGSRYGININTVTESNTMFARRVFELMASNTLVISNYSKGIDRLFCDLVFLVDVDDTDKACQKLHQVLETDYHKHRLRALRYVLKNHTYEDRLVYILNTIGIKVNKHIPKVCVIIFVNHEDELLKAIELFERQRYENKHLLVINLANNPIDTANWVSIYGNESITITDLNMIKNYDKPLDIFITGEYVAFMDIHCFYGNQYLSDMLLNYKYLDDRTVVVKNKHHKPYSFVSDGLTYACAVPKSALRYWDFEQINDNSFVNKLFKIGYRIFNSDEFNFLMADEYEKQQAITINI